MSHRREYSLAVSTESRPGSTLIATISTSSASLPSSRRDLAQVRGDHGADIGAACVEEGDGYDGAQAAGQIDRLAVLVGELKAGRRPDGIEDGAAQPLAAGAPHER